MKLNGIDLVSYSDLRNETSFILSNTTLSAALMLDGQTLIITAANDQEYRRYEGYKVASVGFVNEDSTNIELRVIKKLNDSTEAAINALETNFNTLQTQTQAAQSTANQAITTSAENASIIAEANQGIGELGVIVAETQEAIGELGVMIATMQSGEPSAS